MLRATQVALVQIRISGESPFYFLRRHEESGRERSEFSTTAGALLEVTTHDGFTCLHLKEECATVVSCPRNQCLKFSQLDYVSSIVEAPEAPDPPANQPVAGCKWDTPPPIMKRRLM